MKNTLRSGVRACIAKPPALIAAMDFVMSVAEIGVG
jgi:hypothetical protein